jgi:hypothetical protein
MANRRTERVSLPRRADVQTLAAYFFRQDIEHPKVLDRADREAIRVALRIALEADTVFRASLRSKRPLVKSMAIDHLCDSVRAGMDFFATIKQTAGIIRGVGVAHENGTIRALMAAHGKYMARVGSSRVDLPSRMASLLSMIQIQLIVFAHYW